MKKFSKVHPHVIVATITAALILYLSILDIKIQQANGEDVELFQVGFVLSAGLVYVVLCLVLLIRFKNVESEHLFQKPFVLLLVGVLLIHIRIFLALFGISNSLFGLLTFFGAGFVLYGVIRLAGAFIKRYLLK